MATSNKENLKPFNSLGKNSKIGKKKKFGGSLSLRGKKKKLAENPPQQSLARRATMRQLIRDFAPLTGSEYLAMGDPAYISSSDNEESDEEEIRKAELVEVIEPIQSELESSEKQLNEHLEQILKHLEKVQKLVLDDSQTLMSLFETKEISQLAILSEMIGEVKRADYMNILLTDKGKLALRVKQIANRILQIKSQIASKELVSSRFFVLHQILTAIRLYLESGEDPSREIIKMACDLWPNNSLDKHEAPIKDSNQSDMTILSDFAKVTKSRKSRDRFLVLTPQALKIFKNKEMTLYKFSIPMVSIDKIFSLPRNRNEKEASFCVQTKKKNYIFCFQDLVTMAKWMVKLDDCIITEGMSSKISVNEKISALKSCKFSD